MLYEVITRGEPAASTLLKAGDKDGDAGILPAVSGQRSSGILFPGTGRGDGRCWRYHRESQVGAGTAVA